MSNANGIQIIGDKIYFRMTHVATMSSLNEANKDSHDFKRLLILLEKEYNNG